MGTKIAVGSNEPYYLGIWNFDSSGFPPNSILLPLIFYKRLFICWRISSLFIDRRGTLVPSI